MYMFNIIEHSIATYLNICHESRSNVKLMLTAQQIQEYVKHKHAGHSNYPQILK